MWTDGTLLQVVDQALGSTAARSGAWLVCKPGCSQCCHGAFAINLLDVTRLLTGLEKLQRTDPDRASRVEDRASLYIAETSAHFPGDPATGILGQDESSQEAFELFENERACPVLDPATQTCDLYDARPMTCRVFGPPVRNDEGLGVCELCYVGATGEQIAQCEMIPDPEDIEGQLMKQLEGRRECNGIEAQTTIVGYAVASREYWKNGMVTSKGG